ncbi:MAG: hypothetical protein MZV64_52565 [Ignavibacteriales bacterium]|nr:hypothetical protein [Ignavibacteriales bacterium]
MPQLFLGLLEQLRLEGQGVERFGLAHRSLEEVEAGEDRGFAPAQLGDLPFGQRHLVHGFLSRALIVGRTPPPGSSEGVKPPLFHLSLRPERRS